MPDDTIENEAPTAPEPVVPATAEDQLPETVQKILDAWWGSVTETVGPLISTPAYNALGVARDNLKTQLASALR